jgi:hypothetical protein
MNDEEIVDTLRSQLRPTTAVEVAELLDRLTGGKLSQGTLIMYFKRAFPAIPLGTLLECGAWNRVSGGTLTDSELNDLLHPWLNERE